MSSFTKIKKTWVVGFFCFMLHACDSIEADIQPPVVDFNNFGAIDAFYTTPGNTIAINLLDAFKNVRLSLQAGQVVKFDIVNNPKSGELIYLKDGLYAYTPDETVTEGEDEFIFSVESTKAGVPVLQSDTVTVIVTENTERVSCQSGTLPDAAKADLNQAVLIDVLANDKFCVGDADLLSLTVEKSPASGTAVVRDGKILYTPKAGFVGREGFPYSIKSTNNDQKKYFGYANVRVGVPECKLTLIGDAFAWERPGRANDSLVIDVLKNDKLCGASVSVPISISKQPKNARVSVIGTSKNLNKLVFKPTEGYNEMADFTYKRCEGTDCKEAKVLIISTIKPAPLCTALAREDAVRVSLSSPDANLKKGLIVLNVLLNDRFCRGLKSVFIKQEPAIGKAEIDARGKLTYTIKANYTGEVPLTYIMEDLNGTSSVGKVTINILK